MKLLFLLTIFGLQGTSHSEGISPLIVGGEAATKGEFPSIISLRARGQHICGAAILNANWILTAAHCVIYPPNYYTAAAGEYNLDQTDGTEQFRAVDKHVVHPGFNSSTLANDIALMHVSKPFLLNLKVQAAILPTANFQVTPSVTVAGWGRTSEGGSASAVLQKVTVPSVPITQCKKDYAVHGLGEIIKDATNICAGKAGQDSCQGDSGGPLYCIDRLNRKVNCGIVSFGIGCARPNLPGVYTKVSAYIGWISQNQNLRGRG